MLSSCFAENFSTLKSHTSIYKFSNDKGVSNLKARLNYNTMQEVGKKIRQMGGKIQIFTNFFTVMNFPDEFLN